MITVIDAMNGMGQDWECSEVLRAEVRRLRADLAAAEQRATESEARAERLAAALAFYADDQHYRDVAHWDGLPGHVPQIAIRSDHGRRARAALTAPATQPDERKKAEQAVIAAVREEIHATIWTGEGIIGAEASEGMPKTEAALLALDALDTKEEE